MTKNMLLAKREIRITLALLAATVTASILTTVDLVGRLSSASQGSTGTALQIVVFYAIALSLLYGNLVYQVTRLGFWLRRAVHRAKSADELLAIYEAPSTPSITILVPS